MKTNEMSAAEFVIAHAKKKKKRGKNPSMTYKGIRNPNKALEKAKEDYTWEQKIPQISDEVLTARLAQIKWVTQAMVGIDGKPYPTDETDKQYFDLFYKESNCDPRTQAFNFDENSKIKEKAVGLKEILTKDIFIKIGGYHGFCKMTFAEVFSQVPELISSQVTAFSLNPKTDPQIVNEDHQSTSIIFYAEDKDYIESNGSLPSVSELIKPIDLEKVKRLKTRVKPMMKYENDGFVSYSPGKTEEAFLSIGIWFKVNGSHIHRINKKLKRTGEFKMTKGFTSYQAFDKHADGFNPTYAHIISQIPDKLINDKTVGFTFMHIDYFKTKEGIVHKSRWQMVEKV